MRACVCVCINPGFCQPSAIWSGQGGKEREKERETEREREKDGEGGEVLLNKWYSVLNEVSQLALNIFLNNQDIKARKKLMSLWRK